MKRMILSVAALAMMSGLAVAQTNPRLDDEWATKEGSKFYSDEGMTTLRPMEELQTAFGAMSADQQKWMRDECAAADRSPRFESLCGAINGM